MRAPDCYSTTKAPTDGMAYLRERFESRPPNGLNWIFFGTSGVHGTGVSLSEAALLFDPSRREEAVRLWGDPELPAEVNITFLEVQPRRVVTVWGNARCTCLADVEFLRSLAQSTLAAVTTQMAAAL